MGVRLEPAARASHDSDATPSNRDASQIGEDRWTTIRRQWPAAVCFGVYVLLAMLMYGHFSSLGPSHMAGNAEMDSIVQVWWLAWTAYALPHGHNLFLAPWLNSPFGQNFGVNGSMVALGVLFMPITKLFGPVVTWNIALRLALALSAISMCLVLRRWTRWWPAAFVGGLLYGFSPYMVHQSEYLFLLFVPLPPLVFLLVDEILVRQHWHPGKAGVLLAVVCVLQFFISTEIFASTIVMGAIASVLIVLVHRRDLVRRWRYAVKAFAYTCVVGFLLLGFPVWYTFAGPQHIDGPPAPVALLSQLPADLLASIVPFGKWLDPSGLAAFASSRSSISYSGELYLGLPLIIVACCFAVFFRQRRAILYAATIALIAFIISLGSTLWVNGHATSVPLPFTLFLHFPVLQYFLPARFSLYTALFTAAVVAIGMDELWVRLRQSDHLIRLPPRWHAISATVLLAALAIAVIVPLVPQGSIGDTATNTPSFFTSAALDTIPSGSVVLAYPYTDPETDSTGFTAAYYTTHDIMLDQAVAGMHFKVIGGYGWFPSSTGQGGTNAPAVLEPQSVQALFDVAFSASATPKQRALLEKSHLTADIREFLRRYNVQTVIVLPHLGYPAVVVSHVTSAIGPPAKSGGVLVWSHVRQRLANVRG